MKSKKSTERGQALVIIALSAMVLFGFLALAIDGSAKFSDRRHAQNASDTAALAGALALVNDKTKSVLAPDGVTVLGVEWKLDALNRAKDNGYIGDLTNNQVWVFKCSDAVDTRKDAPLDCGPYEGKPDYISVVILSHVDTTFARVIGFEKTHNLVQTVTYVSKRGPEYPGGLLYSLKTEPCTGDNGNITFGGNGDVVLNGGGASINSGGDDSCGMEKTGCGNLTIINAGGLSTVDNGNINLGSPSDQCSGVVTAPAPTYNAEPKQFPPEMPKYPEYCTTHTGSFSSNDFTQTTTLYPGDYNIIEFPPKASKGFPVYDNIIMEPGVYCVHDMVKLNTDALKITGHGVTIYIENGSHFDITGGTIKLDAPVSGPTAGYLIIVDSDFTGPVPDCTIAGNSENVYIGTIFAPYCNIKFTGTNESGDPTLTYNTQVIGYTITLSGTSDINFTYDPSKVAQSHPEVGLMR